MVEVSENGMILQLFVGDTGGLDGFIGIVVILIVGAGAVYYLFTQRWTELFLTVVIGVGIIAVLFASVIVQETCDSLRTKIKEL